MTGIVVHLLALAGTGKLTVARELAKLFDAALIDSHLINNPVFRAVGANGTNPLPPGVWDLTHRVRQVVLDTIETCAPKGMNYIFTNVICDHDPVDLRSIKAMRESFARAGLVYVPVRLECSEEELVRRRDNPDRAQNCKDINPDKARHESRNHTIIRTGDPHELTLDITTMPPAETARKIRAHLDTIRKEKAA